MMGRNGTARITCCLCVPIYPAAIIISVLGVLSGSAFGIVYAKNIANSAGTFFAPADNKLYNAIPFVGMGCWSLLALVSLFGCIACWTRRARLVSVYFYLLLLQYILDLAFLIAGIVIAFKTAEDQRSKCIADTARAGFSNGEVLCRSALGITALIFISVLGVYKLLSLYTTYVIFKYKRYTAVEESMKNQAKEVEAQRNSAWNNSYDPSQPPQNWSKFED